MKKFIILIPVYNDWQSVFKLLKNIDLQIIDSNVDVSVLIFNDGSSQEKPVENFKFAPACIIKLWFSGTNMGSFII